MKTILVTGGAGFLGSHLCKTLLEQGQKVLCIDNLLTGRMQNIAPLISHPQFEMVEHDVINKFEFKDKIDQIYNLACPASPPHYQRDPIYTTKISFLGALNMLELARDKKALFFQSSTSEVYGDPEVHPQVESYRGAVNPIGIRACYDEGKRVAESLIYDFHRQYKVDIRVARIFNTYGPHMDPKDGRVVSNFIMQALKGEEITIYGDGQQTRSFCYVDDLISGFQKLVASKYTGPVNLGNPNEFTVKELALLVLEKTASKSKISYKDLPSDDPLQRCPNISLARQELDWAPQINLEAGLGKTIEYFKTYL